MDDGVGPRLYRLFNQIHRVKTVLRHGTSLPCLMKEDGCTPSTWQTFAVGEVQHFCQGARDQVKQLFRCFYANLQRSSER